MTVKPSVNVGDSGQTQMWLYMPVSPQHVQPREYVHLFHTMSRHALQRDGVRGRPGLYKTDLGLFQTLEYI